jgi:crotonobetainyl-CoA:carnitine CoA-transferase CaiB-like acyl-CoA transferase
MGGIGTTVRLVPPTLGQHSHAVLTEMGLDERQIGQLIDAEIVT